MDTLTDNSMGVINPTADASCENNSSFKQRRFFSLGKKPQTTYESQMQLWERQMKEAAKDASGEAKRVLQKARVRLRKERERSKKAYRLEAQGWIVPDADRFFKSLADKEVPTKIASLLDSFTAILNNPLSPFNDPLMGSISTTSVAKQAMNQVILDMARLFVSPSLKTFVVWVLDVAGRFGTTMFDMLGSVTSFISTIYNALPNGTFPQQDRQGTMEPQALDFCDGIDYAPFAVGAASLLALSIAGRTVIASKDLSAMMKKYADFGANLSKMRSGITAALELVKFFMTKTQEILLDLTTGGIPNVGFLKKAQELGIDFKEWLLEVDHLTDPTRAVLVKADHRTVDNIRKLNMKWREYVSAIAKNELSIPAALNIMLDRAHVRLKDLAKEIGTGPAQPFRKTPFNIWIYGEPGCGKSSLMAHLAHNILKEANSPYDEMKDLYTRSFSDPYWSGYFQQKVVLIDDILQSKLPIGNRSEAMEHISVVSNVAFTPSQAAVDLKGMAFVSDLIICTTNNPYPMPNEIACVGALHRRRNYLIQMQKIEGATVITQENIHDTRYNILNSIDNRVELEGLTYSQLVRMIAAAYVKFRASDDAMLSHRGFVLEDQGRDLPVELVCDAQPNVEWHGCHCGDYCWRSDWFCCVPIGHRAGGQVSIPHWTMADVEGLYDVESREEMLRWLIELEICEYPERNNSIFDWIQGPNPSDLTRHDWFMFSYLVRAGCLPVEFFNIMFEAGFDTQDWELLHYSEEELVGTYCLAHLYLQMQQEDRIQVLLRLAEADNKAVRAFISTYLEMRWPRRWETIEAQGYNKYEFLKPYLLELVMKDGAYTHASDCISLAIHEIYWNEFEWGFLEREASYAATTARIAKMIKKAEKARDHAALLRTHLEAQAGEISEQFVREHLYLDEKEDRLRARTDIGTVMLEDTTEMCKYYLAVLREPKERKSESAFRRAINAVFIDLNHGFVLMKEKMNELWSNAKTRGFLIYASGMALLIGAGLLIRCLTNKGEEIESEMTSADQVTMRPKKQVMRAEMIPSADAFTKSQKKVVMRSEGSEDPNAMDLVHQVLLPKALVWCKRGTKMMNGIRIADRLLLVPYHLVANCLPEDHISVYLGGTIHHSNLDGAVFRLLNKDGSQSDTAIVRLGASIMPAQNILRHFVSEDSLSSLVNTSAVLPTKYLTGNQVTDMLFDNLKADQFSCVDPNLELFEGTYPVGGEDYRMSMGFMYQANTSKGMCGAPLVALNTALRGKILGIHTAGFTSASMGFAHIVTKEKLERAIKEYGLESTPILLEPHDLIEEYSVDNSEQCFERATVVPEGNFSYIGTVPGKWKEQMPVKSQIIPSIIHDEVVPHVTEPSVLKPMDPRLDEPHSIIADAVEKFSEPIIPFVERDLDACVQHLGKKMDEWDAPGLKRRVLTEDEAINGVGDLARMNMITSSGLPFKKAKPVGAKGKRWQFQDLNESAKIGTTDPKYVVSDPNLRKYIDEGCERLKQGKRPRVLAADNLKDERRKLAKIRSGKTRSFSVMDTAFTILVRMYFGVFLTAMHAFRAKIPPAVGTDPCSPEWTQIYRYWKEISNFGFDGDFKNWDGKCDPQTMYKIVDAISDWYNDGPINRRARRVLVECIIHTPTLITNFIYVKHQGIPSGVPLTADLNSLVNWVYMMYCWRRIMRKVGKLEWLPLHVFDKKVRPKTYGDDNGSAVCPSALHIYNHNTVSAVFAEHGIEYTGADKSQNPPPYKPIEEMTFLKRGFKPHPNYPKFIQAPIELDTIHEKINWIRKGPDNIQALIDNCNDALREAYHVSCEYFTSLRGSINVALKKHRLPQISVEYADLDEHWLSQFIS